MMKQFTGSFRKGALICAVAIAACTVAMPVYQARADKADLIAVGKKDQNRDRMISVTMGKGEVVEVSGEVSDIMVANPAIADVVALQSRKIYVVGSQLGDTNLIILDSEGNVLEKLDIHVKLDERAVQSYLEETYPDEDITVKALNDQVILSGTVSTPAVANRVAQIVAAYIGELQNMRGTTDEIIVNLLNVTGEQQVMLKVKIMEASKTLLKELSTELEISGIGDSLGNAYSGGLSVNNGTGLTDTPYALGSLIFQNSHFGPAGLLMNMLEQDNMIHTLAEPNLTAISGESAGFLAGGEFPVPAGRDQDGNVIIEFRSFGVSLNFLPTVLSGDRISLQLQTEVSSLARDNAVTLADLEIPGLNIRRASTTVEIPSGGGMMIAGLLESNTIKGMAGLPGIKDVPVLGDLVKSRSFNRDETELVILITAYLVSPYAENSKNKPEDPQPVPQEKTTPLAASFADNIRRIYGRKAPDMLSENTGFGYLIN